MKNKVEICYPSYSKKALTFSIDDGNITYDTKFLSILKPAGIKGTFNLNSDRTHEFSESFYRTFYKGYEIANHSKYHPFVFFDGVDYKLSDDAFSEESADPDYIYRVEGRDGFYWTKKPNGWRQAVSESDFIRYVEEGMSELNALFGEGSVRDFVWPYGEQDNAAVKEFIRKTHRFCRKTGCTLALTEFNIPSDKKGWSYNANHMNLLEVMKEYDEYPDDGRLKFFCFGVHSIDYERDGKWGDLAEFAEKYGNRPKDFWYATVGEIFEYEDAAGRLVINDDGVYNPSSLPIYIIIDGERKIVSPMGVVEHS